MDLVFMWVLRCLLVEVIIVGVCYIATQVIRPRWPEWWEQWIIAPYPDDLEPDEFFIGRKPTM